MTDILKTAELLCYPFICRGKPFYAAEKTGGYPGRSLRKMNLDQPDLFWRNSKSFWRFFIARRENELGSAYHRRLGFADLKV